MSTNTPFNVNFRAQETLAVLFTCFVGYLIEYWLGVPYAWGASLGLGLSYPYNPHEKEELYIPRFVMMAGILAIELAIIHRTGILTYILERYRALGFDTQLTTACCVVLLLAPIMDFVSQSILQPALGKRIPNVGIRIISAMLFGLAIGFLNYLGAISFIVSQSRILNLDGNIITASCVLILLAPLNNVIISLGKDLWNSVSHHKLS